MRPTVEEVVGEQITEDRVRGLGFSLLGGGKFPGKFDLAE